MNDILNIIPYLAIYSIIPSIFILNQSAKYRSFKKALPSVIVAWICYSFIVSIDMLFSQFFIVTIIFTIGIVELIFLIYMVYNLWTQSYFNLTAEPQPISIWKQILVSMLISILSALNPYGMFIMHMYFIKHSSK
ncbi:putative membrane protein [Rickettsia hoogstraalii str. RCCE3]|nr:putative membrane protein [Rickettsia hoogstraalii str. RCCE3]